MVTHDTIKNAKWCIRMRDATVELSQIESRPKLTTESAIMGRHMLIERAVRKMTDLGIAPDISALVTGVVKLGSRQKYRMKKDKKDGSAVESEVKKSKE